MEPISCGAFRPGQQIGEEEIGLPGAQWLVRQIADYIGMTPQSAQGDGVGCRQGAQFQAFRDEGGIGCMGCRWWPGQLSALRRPSNARPRVTSSAYSRSPPTGRPEASLVTAMPIDFSILAR